MGVTPYGDLAVVALVEQDGESSRSGFVAIAEDTGEEIWRWGFDIGFIHGGTTVASPALPLVFATGQAVGALTLTTDAQLDAPSTSVLHEDTEQAALAPSAADLAKSAKSEAQARLEAVQAEAERLRAQVEDSS